MNGLHKNKKQANFDLPETIELRKVSGGNLSSSAKEISYNPLKHYYSQRPGGYDYYSQQNSDRKSNWEKEYKLSSSKKKQKRLFPLLKNIKLRT